MSNSPLRRSGMARVNEGSQCFTCHPHVYPHVEWAIHAFTFQPQGIIAVWPVLIFRSAEGRRLSWPGWLDDADTLYWNVSKCEQVPSKSTKRRDRRRIRRSPYDEVWDDVWPWLTQLSTAVTLMNDYWKSLFTRLKSSSKIKKKLN